MVTIQDLRKRMDIMEYLGFDESKKMWVYSYRDVFQKYHMYGLIGNNKEVVELPSLAGLKLSKD